jgi:hypothetical protein
LSIRSWVQSFLGITALRKEVAALRSTLDRQGGHVLATAISASWPIREEIAAWLDVHQLGNLETLARVRQERCSLARFGDGELRSMLLENNRLQFQPGSAALAAELRQILLGQYRDDGLLLCLPDARLGDTGWLRFWPELWPALKKLLPDDIHVGNAMVSRTEFFRFHREEAVSAWRAVWQDQPVCFLTGKGSRFDAIPELFDNTASQRTLHSLPADAYSDIDRFVRSIVAEVGKETLCLISLGPAGTVLAARLAGLGYWAIDIGHISSCYLEAFRGARRPERLPVSQ